MTIDYKWPEEIDPLSTQSLAEACDHAATNAAKRGSQYLADELVSAAKLLRALDEALPASWALNRSFALRVPTN